MASGLMFRDVGSAASCAVISLARVIGAAGLVMALLGGCVSPAIDEPGYLGKVTHSADELFGIVGAARLAVRLDLRGNMTANLTDAVVTDAENDGNSVLTAFDAVQPPDARMVTLRRRADTVLQRAAGDLADLRIAVRRSDRSGQRQGLQALAGDLQDLSRLETSA